MDMVVFIADKIEWDKQGIPPYLSEVEKALSVSLEKAAFSFIKHQLDNKESLKVIHPWFIEAYEDLKRY
jgi:HD superfamily phosphohydrolase YqeK